MKEGSARLRYGLSIEADSLTSWQIEVLEALERVDGVELCVVAVDASPHRRPTAAQLWRAGKLAWTVFNRAASRRATAVQRVDAPRHLRGVPRVDAEVGGEGPWYEISDDSTRRIGSFEPDFLLRFGSRLIRGSVLQVAPLGMWSFHHGDEQVHRGGPPCFWELVNRDPVTGVLLQRLNDRIDAGVPLARAWFPTIQHSYGRNRDQAYFGAVDLPAQVCRRLLAHGPGVLDGAPSRTTAPVHRPPGFRVLAAFLPRLALTWLGQQVVGLTRSDRWHVGVVNRPIQSFVEDPSTNDVRWLPRPPGRSRYVADPFGCPSTDGTTVLVEDYDHRDRHGRLAAYRLTCDGGVEGPESVRSFNDHASYPSLTRVGDAWWCVPENAGSGKVTAYRFDPATLELGDATILLEDAALLDPTMFEWQGRWWLLGTDAGRGANTHLRGWWAEELEGPWHPHAVDPLKVDVRSSRPAGTPFVVDGQLYRPAQDCSRSYGGAVTVNLVERLEPTRFSERAIAQVSPSAGSEYPHGVHTLTALGDRTLVDGTRHRFSWPAFTHELGARMRIARRLPASPRGRRG